MSTQAKMGTAFLSSLIKLREQKSDFGMEDVGILLEQFSSTLSPVTSNLSHDLQKEVAQLSAFIEQAKNEISAFGTSENGETVTGDAALHLDAIVKATEAAGHTIMDAVDAIQTVATAIGGEHQKNINDAITKIYEAFNFQDLTSQRVNKVVKILGELDIRISNMLQLFGAEPTIANIKREEVTDDRHLLNGPQLPDKAPSQDAIDALFSNCKP